MKKTAVILIAFLIIAQIACAQISGTTNYIPKFTSSSTISNSLLYDDGTTVGIGTTASALGYILNVNGGIRTNAYISNALGVYIDGGTANGINNFAGGQSISFRTNNIDNRVLINSSGYVGIGTISPIKPLHVAGTIRSEQIDATGDASNLDIANPNAATTTSDPRGDIWLGNDGKLRIRCVTGYGTAFRNTSNTDDILTINDNGMAIGAALPSGYAFAVNGSAIATSMTVKLTANWPDYVFKPAYTLPSLTEVKTYIDQNHHLPDMPSEQEVKENGLNLGEINTQLTKKVEELTLYLIEKDQQLKEQEARLKKIETQLKTLSQKQ